mgnify:CR=1 FL=1
MTVLENTVLCDNGYGEVQGIKSPQKIKLRSVSYAGIIDKYASFTKEATAINDSTVLVPSTKEDAIVIVDLPLLRAMHVQHKALKVKSTMFDNIKRNGLNVEKQPEDTVEVVAEQPAPLEDSEELGADFKALRNGATSAKIEKYMAYDPQDEAVAVSEVTQAPEVENEPEAISPVTIEQESSRPISRTVPLIAPERVEVKTEELGKTEEVVAEEAPQEVYQESAKESARAALANPMELTDILDLNNMESLRAYLVQTMELKKEAATAKQQEEAARESAAQAERETEGSRDALAMATERVVALQESLKAQAEQSYNQTNMYISRKAELEAEKSEIDKTLGEMNDMLAMSSEEETSKEKTK